jgi:hypothetical protein
MSDGEEMMQDYSEEEEEEEENSDYLQEGSEEEDDDEKELKLGRQTTMELPKNYTYQVIDEISVKSLLESKIVSLANSFQECNIEPGYYWNILRKNNFFINQAVTHCNDHVFEIME